MRPLTVCFLVSSSSGASRDQEVISCRCLAAFFDWVFWVVIGRFELVVWICVLEVRE